MHVSSMCFALDTTQHHHTQLQHANVIISDSVDQQDDTVMDNVIISCTVGGEEALVNKACSCTCSRRRLVRQKMLIVTRQCEQINSNLSKCHFYVAI